MHISRSGVDRYANVIVWDEVSQMWMETAKFALERFPSHKHIFCGDPGFQLPPIRQIGDDRQLTPFNAKDFESQGGHVEHFNENRRCKCPVLERILKTLRWMIEQPDKFSTQSIGRWVLRKFQEMGRVITIEEAVAKYKIDDMILVSRNSEPHNYVKEYTDTLQASQPSTVKASLQVQSKEPPPG